jgi:U3 small nucleolar RNA-associated protein 19
MPGSKSAAVAGSKRKRESSKTERRHTKTKAPRASSEDSDDPQNDIALLEAQVLESRKHYNNIATLLQLARNADNKDETSILAAVASCRIFTRLLASGDMVKNKGTSQSEALIVSWLKERYREYISVLLDSFMRSEHAPKQSVALTLLMRLVKEESKQKDYNWKKTPLSRVIETLLLLQREDATRDEFAEKYFTKFDDIRMHTFQTIQ